MRASGLCKCRSTNLKLDTKKYTDMNGNTMISMTSIEYKPIRQCKNRDLDQDKKRPQVI